MCLDLVLEASRYFASDVCLENCTRVLIIMISFRYHCRCCRSENRMGSFQIGQQHVGRIIENEDEELIDFPAECLDTTLM